MFFNEPGPEGWEHAIGFLICLLSLVPLIIDLIMKVTIKDLLRFLLIELGTFILIFMIYKEFKFI